MQIRQENNYENQYFDSVVDFRTWINNTTRNAEAENASEGTDADRKEFTLTDTMQEADQYLTSEKIWEDGIAKSKVMIANLPQPQGDGTKINFKNAVAGGSVNLGRYLQGKPDSMRQMKRTTAQKRGKIIDLYFDPCISGGMSTDAMIAYGCAVYSIVNELQLQGYRINLYAAYTSKQHGDKSKGVVRSVCTVKIKSSDEVLDTNSMLYAIAHPSMFRRHWFAWLERKSFWSYGYGQVTEATAFKRSEVMWGYNTNPTNSFFMQKLQNLPSGMQNNSTKIAEHLIAKIYKQIESADENVLDGEVHFQFT